MSEINKKNGKAGGNLRWDKYKLHLITEMRKMTDKKELDFYLSLNPSPSDLQKAYLELLTRRDEKRANS